ncbi:helix-turn-helix transcriptional regulator [Brevundimonas sp.]|uniref:helix-turn-helix transcriptional regulator n=1 Tax=Brevundimonas sp. TaxID=1871086 RepID=UPI002E0ED787|nr:helix-turn-helix domain-containing protein [Brevundimonas sp.]
MRRTRRRWALSQAELAHLIGSTQSVVSRLEAGSVVPDLALAFRLQAVFGSSPRALFPELYGRAEEIAMANGAVLDAKLGSRTDYAAGQQRRLLASMVHRASPNNREA